MGASTCVDQAYAAWVKRQQLRLMTANSTCLGEAIPLVTEDLELVACCPSSATVSYALDKQTSDALCGLQTQITELAAEIADLPGALNIQTEVHFTAEDDGHVGSGTFDSPYRYVSKTAFDAQLAALPAGTAIRLEVGVFITGGLTLQPNCIIRGRGSDQTVLKLADQSLQGAGQIWMIQSPTYGDSFEIHDIAIDCNNANQLAVIISQVGAYITPLYAFCKYFIAENVDVTGGYANPGEGFQFTHTYLTSATSVASPARAIFRNVWINGTVGYASNICQLPSNIAAYSSNHAIAQYEDCGVLDALDPTGAPTGSTAFGGGATLMHVRNCYADQVGNAVNADTGVARHTLIEGCVFSNVAVYGLLFNGNNTNQYGVWVCRDTSISVIDATGGDTGQAFRISMLNPTMVRFERCVFSRDDTTNHYAYELGQTDATPNVVFEDCIFPAEWDGLLPQTLGAANTRFINCFTNQYKPCLRIEALDSRVIAECTYDVSIDATNAVASVCLGKLTEFRGIVLTVDFLKKTYQPGAGEQQGMWWQGPSLYNLKQLIGNDTPESFLYYKVIDGSNGYLFLRYDFTGHGNGQVIARIRAVGSMGAVQDPQPAIGAATALTISTFPATGSGAALTNLNATQLTTGTMPTARLPAHLVITGTTPTPTYEAGAGTAPGAIVASGTDTAGRCAFITGTTCTVNARVVKITFASAFAAAPYVAVTPTETTGAFPDFTTEVTASAFYIRSKAAAFTDATTYTFNWVAIG